MPTLRSKKENWRRCVLHLFYHYYLLKNKIFTHRQHNQVADDPETLRIKQNTKHISNVAYHGDLAKKAAMEKQREVAEVADNRGK